MILYAILSDVSPQWNLYNYRQMYMYAYATSSPNHKILILLCWITTEVLEWQFIYALMSTVANKNRVNHLVIYDSTGTLSQFSSNSFSSLMGEVDELGCQKYPTLHFIVNKHGCVHYILFYYYYYYLLNVTMVIIKALQLYYL